MKQVVHATRFFVLLLAGVALSITSCQKEELQSNSQQQNLLNNSQKQDQQKKPVPFKGKFTLAFTQNGPVSTGEGTHIGRFTAVGVTTQTEPSIIGTSVSTGENGAEIWTTDAGIAHAPDANGISKVELTCTITGGTGRFAEATGMYKTIAFINFSLGAGSATFDGWISY